MSNRKFQHYWLTANYSAVRVGEYKYMIDVDHRRRHRRRSTPAASPASVQHYGYGRLYNLYLDPKESRSYMIRKLVYIDAILAEIGRHRGTFREWPGQTAADADPRRVRRVAASYGNGPARSITAMRMLLVSDLHYTLKQFDWLVGAAADYDLVVVAGDLLDIGSRVEPDAQIVVVLEYLAPRRGEDDGRGVLGQSRSQRPQRAGRARRGVARRCARGRA